MVPPDRVGRSWTPEIAASRTAAILVLGYFYLGLLLKGEGKVKGNCGRDEIGCPVKAGRLRHSGKMAVVTLLSMVCLPSYYGANFPLMALLERPLCVFNSSKPHT